MAHLHQNNRAGIRNRFSPDRLDQEAHCVDIAVHGCKVQRGVSPTVCRLHVCTRLEHSTRTKKKAFGSQRKEHPECSRKTRNRPFSFSSFQTQLKLKATVCPGHRRPGLVKRLQHVYVSFGGCQVGRSRGIERLPHSSQHQPHGGRGSGGSLPTGAARGGGVHPEPRGGTAAPTNGCKLRQFAPA